MSDAVPTAEEIRRIAQICGELSLVGCGIVQYYTAFPPVFDPHAPPDTPLPALAVVEVPPEKVEGIFHAIWKRLRETPEYRPLAAVERQRDEALAALADEAAEAERWRLLLRALVFCLDRDLKTPGMSGGLSEFTLKARAAAAAALDETSRRRA